MKKIMSLLLAAVLVLGCVLAGIPQAHAAKKEESRAIAIVYDNSGSMHEKDDGSVVKDWCRAIYAMEVFGSMLNDGDILQIYPMHPITVGGKEYTMNKPYEITDAKQASTIREIYTEAANGTPIESVDSAAAGIQKVNADKKYLIILTDGDYFHQTKDGKERALSQADTKAELDKRVRELANEKLTVMFLGIGKIAVELNTPESEYFIKRKAGDTAKVLSTLTEMCNQIFGRDILPEKNVTDDSLEFDISMKKLIVFVQGENISGLKITGQNGVNAGQQVGSLQTKYSTKGAGNRPNEVDESLQGMMVTYEGSEAGKYSIEYSGNATSIEAYYEPDVDLSFVFTDANGNNVDPNALYEGEYKVSFGMKDARTGQLINSELLGDTHYAGTYTHNGQVTEFTSDDYSGEIPINLMMDDKFEAELTVTYLSGYTIRKDSSDFGWPEGGITVAPRPAGDLRLEITGGQDPFSLQDLEEGEPFIAKVYHQGEQLTGKELEKVKLNWDTAISNAKINDPTYRDDYIELKLSYKDPSAPQNTTCGVCSVTIYASYAAQGSAESQAQCPLMYNIEDDFSPLQMELTAPQDYILISELDESDVIRVNLTLDGARLTPADFENVELKVDTDIAHELTPCVEDSAYEIKLQSTPGIDNGKHKLTVTGYYTDHIGRETHVDEDVELTLGNLPRWLKLVIFAGILLVLFLIIWWITHIKVLPKKAHTTRRLSGMSYDGEDVKDKATFAAEIQKNGAKTQARYAGRTFGIMMDVTPGPESYLYKKQTARSAEVKPDSVRKFGPAKIQELTIGTVKYIFDDDKNKLVPAVANQKPFPLRNGMTIKYSGVMPDAGIDRDFEVLSKIDFNKQR